MNYKNFFRTDMADEARKLWLGKTEEKTVLEGVAAKQTRLHGLELTEIEILNELGEKALGKSRGKYFSLELPEHFDKGCSNFPDIVLALADIIKRCFQGKADKILISALGNPDITPDALGNLSASNILVTAHLDKQFFPQFASTYLCRPGVLGTSGIETAAQIKALSKITEPQLVIVIDALAGSDTERLCRCIQVSDAGISPGSGVGNNREDISFSSLGVPVISIGMPTVIDAGFFGGEECSGMFVTPRNIDSMVRNGARLIAYGINLAVHHQISIEDIDALIG